MPTTDQVAAGFAHRVKCAQIVLERPSSIKAVKALLQDVQEELELFGQLLYDEHLTDEQRRRAVRNALVQVLNNL